MCDITTKTTEATAARPAAAAPDVELLTVDDEEFVRLSGRGDEHDDDRAAPPIAVRVLLIFVHGAFTPARRYRPLLRRIQRRCLALGVRLDVGHGTYARDIPSKERTLEILDELNERDGEEYDAKFLCGHSVGALVATELALPSSIDGLIFVGSCLSLSSPVAGGGIRSIASFPKPVLTVMGGSDGFMRPLVVSREMDDLDAELERRCPGGTSGGARDRRAKLLRDEMDVTKPVIVLGGVNHMQAADDVVGDAILRTGRHDFRSDLTSEEAWEGIAGAASDFVLTAVLRLRSDLLDEEQHGGEHGARYVRSCREQLGRARRSREAMRPFWELSKASSILDFAEEVQRGLANLGGEQSVVPHLHTAKDDFLYSKPKVSLAFLDKSDTCTAEGEAETVTAVNVHVVAQDSIHLHPDLPASVGQQSPTYAIKAMSQDFFLAKGGGSLSKAGYPTSLRELNERTMERVLNEFVTPEQRAKYQREGRKLQFGPDVFVEKPPAWVETPIWLEHDGDVTRVRCPYTTTGVDDTKLPVRFRGMHYVKPMTAAQIYEWIVYDSFRRIPKS